MSLGESKRLMALLVASAVLGATAPATTAVAQVLELEILDASITLSPGQVDYEASAIAAEGAAGIDVRLRSDNSSGLILKVRCDDPSPEIALDDLYFKTQTSPGAGGASQSSYVPIQATDQDLWSSGVAENGWKTIQTDIKVQKLWSYPDAGGGGTTTYTNTLTFTVVVQ